MKKSIPMPRWFDKDVVDNLNKLKKIIAPKAKDLKSLANNGLAKYHAYLREFGVSEEHLDTIKAGVVAFSNYNWARFELTYYADCEKSPSLKASFTDRVIWEEDDNEKEIPSRVKDKINFLESFLGKIDPTKLEDVKELIEAMKQGRADVKIVKQGASTKISDIPVVKGEEEAITGLEKFFNPEKGNLNS